MAPQGKDGSQARTSSTRSAGSRASPVNRGAQTVTVEVDADALSVVPGFQKHINVDLEAPVEQVTP